jgi:O-succinylbenzoic acid--CoA ligase
MEHDVTMLDRFHLILAGGAALPDIVERRLKLCSSKVYLTYGMTETISHVAVRNVRESDKMFTALPGVELSKSENGCLVINAAHLDHQIIETSDMIDLVDERKFILLGRKDDVINSGGIKFFPADIESKIGILFHERFFIWKKPDDVFGEKVVLYIEGEEWGAFRLSAMSNYFEKNLLKYEVPKETIFIQRFDTTETDKLIRKNYV